MSYFYSLYSYYIWGEDTTIAKEVNNKPLSLISRNELMEKIALITKNKKQPQVVVGYGKVKEKKIEIVYISKKSGSTVKIKTETEIHVTNGVRPAKHDELLKTLREFKFNKMRKDAAPDKSWTKVAETSEEKKKATLEEISRIKKNLSSVNQHYQSFAENWKDMTKYDNKKWRLNGKRKGKKKGNKKQRPGRPTLKRRAKVRE